MKIDAHIIFEIHRLGQLGYKQRKIARQLGISRLTVKKYLQNTKKNRVKPVGRPSPLLGAQKTYRAARSPGPSQKAAKALVA